MREKKKYKESKIKAEEARRQQQRQNPMPCSSSSSNQGEESNTQNDGEGFRPDENKSYTIQSETTLIQGNSPSSEANAASKKYSKREVFSNWKHWELYDELERPREEQEEEENPGVNFRKLLAAPTSAEGHFMFKSEKLEAPTSAGNLFTLDLEALSQGLSTIPFYKQLELPTSYFSNEEIKSMDEKAVRLSTAASSCSLLLDEIKQGLKAKKVTKINSVLTSEDKISLCPTSNVQVPQQASISEPFQPVTLQSPSIQPQFVKSTSIELPSFQSLSIQSPSAQPPLLDNSSPNIMSEDSTPSCSNPSFLQTLTETSKGQRDKKIKKSQNVNAIQVLQNGPDNFENNNECDPFVNRIPEIVETNTQPLVASSSTPVVKLNESNDDLEAWLDSVLDD